MTGERVAVFRPADGRLEAAVEQLRALGAEPVADPLLAIEPTEQVPREDADVVILTSRTGAALLPDEWDPGAATVCAIGETTARAIEAAGKAVDLVPATYSSAGLVEALADRVVGARVELARSDHGSSTLPEGLTEAGAYLHETVLYRLVRPPRSGGSTERAAAGDLDAALFTSSLTVEHFLAAAEERSCREAAIAGLGDAVIGAIGEPTRRTAEVKGIQVDAVPPEANFDALARAVIDACRTA